MLQYGFYTGPEQMITFVTLCLIPRRNVMILRWRPRVLMTHHKSLWTHTGSTLCCDPGLRRCWPGPPATLPGSRTRSFNDQQQTINVNRTSSLSSPKSAELQMANRVIATLKTSAGKPENTKAAGHERKQFEKVGPEFTTLVRHHSTNPETLQPSV